MTHFFPHKIRGKTDFTQFPAVCGLKSKVSAVIPLPVLLYLNLMWDCAFTEEII